MTEFTALFDIYRNAVFRKDIEAFLSVFDDNVLVFDMWTQWTYEGLPAWRTMVQGWFDGLGTDRDAVDFDDIQVHATDRLATATAIVKFTAMSAEGQPLRSLQNRLTWVALKKGNAWKIIHQHTSAPIDFETMKPRLHK